MSTPQRRRWPGFSLTPRSENHRSTTTNKGLSSNTRIGDGSLGVGKSVAFLESSPPSGATAYENGRGPTDKESDPVGLAEMVTKLENELFEYQYNMGLLVIEKNEAISKYEELQMALSEAKDAIKREQGAHLIAINVVEKREEDLRKALGVEKQCVTDLEKALREMRSEYAEIKFTADSKLAEAKALEARIDEKSLEVEAKGHAVDAKLAEANRKISEVDRKLQELEARENSLRRERSSFNSEREAHEATLSRQREDLLEWERRLQAVEERIGETRRILDQKEERANEFERSYKQKERELEESQKRIDATNIELIKKEDDICNRLASLSAKEKDVEAATKRIEKKERELLALEEKLTEREKSEIQKLVEEHQKELDAKQQQFDLEIIQKRKTFDDELKSKADEVEKKEVVVRHMEEKVTKREVALEKKLEKFKQKEKDLESKSTVLREKEKSIRAEEKKLEREKKDMLIEKEDLLNLKEELEQRKAEIEEQLLKIQQEREQLKVTEEERSEHLHLQSELKQEIDKYRLQKEVLCKEVDGLKVERESFEAEWEALDEKKAEIEKDLRNLTEEKEKFEKWRRLEEERLRNENLTAQSNIQSELEALELAKEAFAAEKNHEEKLLSERAQSERSQLVNDFEMRKRELEIEMQKKLEDKEKKIHERERQFEEERERELGNINYLREVAERGMDDMKEERGKIDKQKEELAANKKDIERHRLEIEKDIEELVILNSKVKDNREQFLKERERFIAFVDKIESCEKCREIVRSFVFSDQPLHNTESPELLSRPSAENYLRNGVKLDQTPGLQNNETSPGSGDTATPKSGGKLSWLRKCASSLFSPGNKREISPLQNLAGGSSLLNQQANVEPASDGFNVAEDFNESSFGVVNDSVDIERMQSDDNVTTIRGGATVSAEPGVRDEKQEEASASELSGLNRGRIPGKKGRPRVSRSRSVKAVVRDAEAILGHTVELSDGEHPNGHPEESGSSFADMGNRRGGRKRNRAHTSQISASVHDGDDSEGDSVTARGRRKRRQKLQAPAGNRYNLRGSRNVASKGPVVAPSDFDRGKTIALGGSGTFGESSFSKATHSAGATSENGGGINLVQAEAEPKITGGHVTGRQLEDIDLSEGDINRTPGAYVEEHSDRILDRDGDHQGEETEGDDGDDEECEPMHPGEVSIGKKLWTFLTT
ncbi:hypothetical protein Dimus_033957 [Dionaea muscipula]